MDGRKEAASLSTKYDASSGWETHNLGGLSKAVRSGFNSLTGVGQQVRETLTGRRALGYAVGAAAVAGTLWNLDEAVGAAYNLGTSRIGLGDGAEYVAQEVRQTVVGAAKSTAGTIAHIGNVTWEKAGEMYASSGEIKAAAFVTTALGLMALKTLYSPQLKRHGSHVSGFEYFRYYVSDRLYCWGEDIDFKQFRKDQFEYLKSQKQ